ncbi:MAG: VWA domain-containing protein [Planctomycetes bacterium]|nr:VWA domain-containing protein [Planctomycetota bacterium]
MSALHWQAPSWWLLLPLVTGALAWRARQRPRLPLLPAGPDGRRPASWRQRFAGLPTGLELLALACAVAALARPVQFVPAPPERLVRDVMLCVDRSSSMAAEDLRPGEPRLAVALAMAARLVDARPDDRFGCVEFARYPDLRCPPTLDHAAVRELLASVRPVGAESAEDATGIGTAVALAASVLARSPVPGRLVVLLTDGEENVATVAHPDEIAPRHAAQLCARLGIRVHTVVVGSDPDVDATAVQELAAVSGGRHFRAGDASTLLAVADAIDGLEPRQYAEPRLVAREWFAALVVAALGLGWLAHALARTWFAVLP